MKQIMLILAAILCCQFVFGQNLVVNKTWNYDNNRDAFQQILLWKDSTRYVTANSAKFAFVATNIFVPSTCLVKINNLDTIWIRDLKAYGTPRGLVRFGNKLIVLVATDYSTISNSKTRSIEILEVDTNGTVLRRLPFVHPFYRYGPAGLLISSDSCYVVYGDVTGSPTKPGFQCDWCLIKYNPRTNRTEFEKYYNPGSSYSCGCYAENAPGGGFLVSGTNGAKVSYVHTNVMGDTLEPIKSIKPFTKPVVSLFVSVKQHTSGNFVFSASGNNFNNLNLYALGMVDPAGNMIWQKTLNNSGGGAIPIQINNDGSFCDFFGQTQGSGFNKIGTIYYRKTMPDSTVAWVQTLIQNSSNVTYTLNDGVYESDSSVTFVGRKYTNPGQSLFYMARITGIGQPFNPVTSVSIPKETEAVSLYPNPTSGQVQLNRSGVLQLYDGLGRVMGTWQVEAGQALDLGGLAKGIYYWRLNGYAGHRVVVE